MGKKGGVLLDSGKTAKFLSPLDAQKKAAKKKRVQQNEEVRRKQKFMDAIKNDPESIRRKVGALEKQSKQGTLSMRQRREKNEMKELLEKYEPQFKREAAIAARGALVVTMENAFGDSMDSVDPVAAPPGGVSLTGVLVNHPEDIQPVAAPPPSIDVGAQAAVVGEDFFGGGGSGGNAVPVDAVIEGEAVSAASSINPELVKARKEEQEQKEVKISYNPSAMAALVPSSVLRRKTTSAKHSKVRADKNAAVSAAIAPKPTPQPTPPVPQPIPTPAASFTSINLVPDYDGSDSDMDSLDEPSYVPSGGGVGSVFFGAGGGVVAQPTVVATVEAVNKATEDDEYKKFMESI